jgi:NAD(P)H-quinone oxidoreductase subunit 4L
VPAASVHLSIEHFLVVGALLFSIGLFTALAKRNAIAVLFGVELMLNAVNLTLVTFSRFGTSDQPITGHVFVVFVLTVAAAEAAVALALAMAVYRTRRTVEVDELDLMKF